MLGYPRQEAGHRCAGSLFQNWYVFSWTICFPSHFGMLNDPCSVKRLGTTQPAPCDTQASALVFFFLDVFNVFFSHQMVNFKILNASQESPENGSCPSPKIRSPSRDRDDLGIRWPSVALLPTAMPPVQPRFVWRSNSDSWWAGHTPGEWDEKNKSG